MSDTPKTIQEALAEVQRRVNEERARRVEEMNIAIQEKNIEEGLGDLVKGGIQLAKNFGLGLKGHSVKGTPIPGKGALTNKATETERAYNNAGKTVRNAAPKVAGVAATATAVGAATGKSGSASTPKAPEAPKSTPAPVSTGPKASETPKTTKGGYFKSAPNVSKGDYSVKSGETLSGIAKKHGTSVGAIQSMNKGLTDPSKIAKGAKLNLPTSVKEEEEIVDEAWNDTQSGFKKPLQAGVGNLGKGTNTITGTRTGSGISSTATKTAGAAGVASRFNPVAGAAMTGAAVSKGLGDLATGTETGRSIGKWIGDHVPGAKTAASGLRSLGNAIGVRHDAPGSDGQGADNRMPGGSTVIRQKGSPEAKAAAAQLKVDKKAPSVGASGDVMKPGGGSLPTQSKFAQSKIGNYNIKRGDTASAIAKRSGISLDKLKADNPHIKDINKIAAGARLVVNKEEVESPMIQSFLELMGSDKGNVFEAAKHLSAKQKKIASVAGDPDKIDADDFKALRSKKVEEASVDHLGGSTVTKDPKKYVDPSTPKTPYTGYKGGNAAGGVIDKAKGALDKKGVREEVEEIVLEDFIEYHLEEGYDINDIISYIEENYQLDELSDETLRTYTKKATIDKKKRINHLNKGEYGKGNTEHFRNMMNRSSGVERALNRIYKEEVEEIVLEDFIEYHLQEGYDINDIVDFIEENYQLDEVSKELAARYVVKAAGDRAKHNDKWAASQGQPQVRS
jgi:LysM repeat protein